MGGVWVVRAGVWWVWGVDGRGRAWKIAGGWRGLGLAESLAAMTNFLIPLSPA